MHQEQRRLVVEVTAVHRSDQRHIVDVLGEVRHDLRDIHAALAVFLKLERRRQQALRLVGRCNVRRHLAHGHLTGVLLERRLGVKQVYLTRPAVHEEVNDRLGLGLEMRRLRTEIVDLPPVGCSGHRRVRSEQIGSQQRGQSRSVESVPEPREEIAAAWTAIPFGGSWVFGLLIHHHPQSIKLNSAEFSIVWQ